TAGMTLLVYGFIRASEVGWGNGFTLLSFAGAVVVLGAFLIVQARVAHPLMPLRMFADRTRTSAYGTMFLLAVGMFGSFFLLTPFLQAVLRSSRATGGRAFLPMTASVFGMVRLVPRLLTRYPPKRILFTGGLLMTAGMAWLTQLDAGSGYVSGLLAPMVLL